MDLTGMIETGSTNPVLLFFVALLLGGLHGLEPGHSKTMMAAYIIAVHGTVKQAVLLGVSAALSHSVIVWGLALIALTWGNALIGEELEPWFMIVSGAMVLMIAGWMLAQHLRSKAHEHHHGHDHGHHHEHRHKHHHGHEHSHDHTHSHAELEGLDDAHMDAHARAHAQDIRARLAAGRTGTWQTILFGLTGGLIPCPAAITVFILCLHLGKVTLGITLVSAFSIGLAITLVAVGVVAALGLRALSAKSAAFDRFMTAAPWVSAALIALIGVIIIWTGVSHLTQAGHAH